MDNIKDEIKFGDFEKLDIRVGTILECEPVEKSEKLLRLRVDFGDIGERQILTGMARWYSEKNFVGLQTLFIINLEPRKLMGLESQGMLLSLGSDMGTKPILITINEPATNGEQVN